MLTIVRNRTIIQMVRIRTNNIGGLVMNIRSQIRQVNTALSATLNLYTIWAKKCDISYNALVILYTLDDYKTCTQKQICEWWALPKQTVHGILLAYEKQGYITISSNQENKRERLVSFTQEGKQYATSILTPLYALEEKAMERLGDVKRKQLIDCNNAYFKLLQEEMEHG